MDRETTPGRPPLKEELTSIESSEKTPLYQRVIAELTTQLQVSQAAADSAHSQATHSECIAQSRYDTLGLELAYLARGQSARSAQLHADISQVKALAAKHSLHHDLVDQIRITSLVKLKGVRGTSSFSKYFFILPISGGTMIQHADRSIQIISTESPLGSALIGKYQDDLLCVNHTEYQVTEVY